jgi:hypothetical protein
MYGDAHTIDKVAPTGDTFYASKSHRQTCAYHGFSASDGIQDRTTIARAAFPVMRGIIQPALYYD